MRSSRVGAGSGPSLQDYGRNSGTAFRPSRKISFIVETFRFPDEAIRPGGTFVPHSPSTRKPATISTISAANVA
jgi:hypothetical protein